MKQVRRFFEKLYRSPLGRIMSQIAWILSAIQRPFMVYGFYNQKSKKFQKYTRISSSVVIMNKNRLSIGDHAWVWHHSILDATEALTIGEGVQIGAWVGIFTHGSESSIRLLGNQFVHIPNERRLGYTRGPVKIGAYTFIGAGSIVLPGVTIGKGCLIGSGTLVTKDIPDYSIVVGSPGKIKGSTIDLDINFFLNNDFSGSYYDKEALEQVLNKIHQSFKTKQ